MKLYTVRNNKLAHASAKQEILKAVRRRKQMPCMKEKRKEYKVCHQKKYKQEEDRVLILALEGKKLVNLKLFAQRKQHRNEVKQ